MVIDIPGITDSPWLERTYKEKELPHPIVQNLVFGWIIFLTFKTLSSQF